MRGRDFEIDSSRPTSRRVANRERNTERHLGDVRVAADDEPGACQRDDDNGRQHWPHPAAKDCRNNGPVANCQALVTKEGINQKRRRFKRRHF